MCPLLTDAFERAREKGWPPPQALLGRVSWVESVDPVRGARLRAELDRIRW